MLSVPPSETGRSADILDTLIEGGMEETHLWTQGDQSGCWVGAGQQGALADGSRVWNLLSVTFSTHACDTDSV